MSGFLPLSPVSSGMRQMVVVEGALAWESGKFVSDSGSDRSGHLDLSVPQFP